MIRQGKVFDLADSKMDVLNFSFPGQKGSLFDHVKIKIKTEDPAFRATVLGQENLLPTGTGPQADDVTMSFEPIKAV